MTKQEVWDFICKKNPDFLTRGAYLAPAGLKMFFETAYKVGFENGCAESRHSDTGHGVPDFMKGIFK